MTANHQTFSTIMRMVLLGAPGSGKATQAKLLAAQHQVAQISIRELLREATPTSEANNIPQDSDEHLFKLLENRLRARNSKRGFIIEDFPRNIPQAQTLDTLLGMLGKTLQISVYLKVDDATLVKRITGRLLCEQCGSRYNRHYFPPKKANQCDSCNSKLVSLHLGGRKAITGRIATHNAETAALNAYYKAQHKLRTVSASDREDTATIHRKICDLVDLEIRPLQITALETAAETANPTINTIIAGGQISRITPPKSYPPQASKAKTTPPATPTKAASTNEPAACKSNTKTTATRTAVRKKVVRPTRKRTRSVAATSPANKKRPRASRKSTV